MGSRTVTADISIWEPVSQALPWQRVWEPAL